ncbi:MAG: patatin-like phospholipase family protein [Pseudomonadota bacterium]
MPKSAEKKAQKAKAKTQKKKAKTGASGKARKTATKSINLALQGGGSHGAFAWGVLDRLLEDGRVDIEATTSASAGSMNAVVLAHGLTEGGPQAARAALHNFWERVSGASRYAFDPSSAAFTAPPFLGPDWQPMFQEFFVDTFTRLTSPYQLNPLNINPLRSILEESVDFERLREASAIKLFISATNVRSGKIKIFEQRELSADTVMASACLPFLFQAVEIDGEAYWDGGYMGNPPIYPLIYNCDSRDVVVIHLNPITRTDIPKDPGAIIDRVNEISFNSSLMREMRAIAFVTELIEKGQIVSRDLRQMLIHSIEAEDLMRDLSAASKLNPEWAMLVRLRDEGRAVAERWLDMNFDDLGSRSTVDIRDKYL